MSDNGKNPVAEDKKEPQLIFKAELQNQRIMFTRKTSHIPTLDFVANSLIYEITELRAQEKAKEHAKNQQLIRQANNLTFQDFLKRNKRR